REHLDSGALADRTGVLFDELGECEGSARPRVLAELRQAIVRAPLSEELTREIDRRYRELGAGHVAVRSSATAEDLPGHSFAGQYDTFLGVSDLAGCIEAVRRCWASLWTERAFGYRERNGIDHAGVDMAVMVQELVPAEASGVLFTADPVTGRTDRLVIESCFGLGETLVSGKVTPDRLVLSKRKLNILKRSVAAKTVETVLDPRGGVRELAVAGERAARPCLDDATARRLGKLALRAEKAFGSPQDVEWAAARGKLYILQSRPITTLAPETSWEDRQVWTNTNSGEIFPDVATPLTWSIIEPLDNGVFREMFAAAGIDIGDRPTAGLVAGRIYHNATTLMGILKDIPFMGEVVDRSLEVFGGDDAATAVLERAMSEGPSRSFLGRLWFLVRGLGFVRKVLWHTPERCELFIAAERRANGKLDRIDAALLSDAEIVLWIRHIATGLMEGRGALFPPVSAGCFVALDDICRKWFGDADGALARRLIGGLSGMQSAEAGLALWRLAELAGGNECVARAVLSERTFGDARARITREAGGDEFLAEWRAFMREHGHHTRGELEAGNPRWSERPDEVLGMVRGYLEGVGRVSPLARRSALAADRRKLTRECRSRLRNPVKRILFDHILKKAQRGCLVRENMKSESVRTVAALRRMLLELGRRLVKHGVLRERDDVFFLRVEEIEPVARGAAPADVHETIAGRRAEHERNLAITPPFIVVGRFDPDEFVPDAVDGGATTFEGIASSTGVVTGPARVVTRAGEDTVRPGEILVAPFTDPGWTPFFVNAAGIVMDMGGLLSHGSIIAREYGIPAVVNVGPATKIIQTGQMLRVDGDRGIVSVLGAEPGDPGGPDRPVDAPLVRQSAEPDAPAGRGNDSLEDRQVWSNMNTGEVLPDVMTPFSWSVIGPFLDNAFRGIFERIGLGPGERPVSGLIAGRAYFNLTTSVSTMTSLPFSHSV
ncbi:MAG: PEP/pyruvate-binding domain-containing protein, partial [Planctomycetota bacterium]